MATLIEQFQNLQAQILAAEPNRHKQVYNQEVQNLRRQLRTVLKQIFSDCEQVDLFKSLACKKKSAYVLNQLSRVSARGIFNAATRHHLSRHEQWDLMDRVFQLGQCEGLDKVIELNQIVSRKYPGRRIASSEESELFHDMISADEPRAGHFYHLLEYLFEQPQGNGFFVNNGKLLYRIIADALRELFPSLSPVPEYK